MCILLVPRRERATSGTEAAFPVFYCHSAEQSNVQIVHQACPKDLVNFATWVFTCSGLMFRSRKESWDTTVAPRNWPVGDRRSMTLNRSLCLVPLPGPRRDWPQLEKSYSRSRVTLVLCRENVPHEANLRLEVCPVIPKRFARTYYKSTNWIFKFSCKFQSAIS